MAQPPEKAGAESTEAAGGKDAGGVPLATGLRWGVKASLRTYVVGVGGDFTVDPPARLEDGVPVLPRISDTEETRGRVLRFGGAIHIQAHGGMMNVHWTNLQIEFTEEASRLTVAGADPDAGRISIADLTAIEGSRLTFRAALTVDAAAGFGFTYPVGTELDEVVLTA